MELVVDPWLEASRLLREELALHPGFADLRNLEGLLCLAEGRAAEAAVAFEAALAVNPSYLRARFNRLVAMRLRDGELDPALWGELDLTHESEPERSLFTAWFLSQSGDPNGTRAVLDHLARQTRWTGAALFIRAVHEQIWGNEAAAASALAAAAHADASYHRVLGQRGWSAGTRQVAGVLRGPLEALTPADPASWNPAAGELYEHLGAICARAGQVPEAEDFYTEAFLRHGRAARHLVNLSQLDLVKGDEEKAVASLQRAIEIDPTEVTARSALGFEYQSQGFHEEAVMQFEVAVRLRPEYPDLQYNLGLLYHSQGRHDEAGQCLRRAIEINPQYFQARTSLAQLLLVQERFEEALAELRALASGGLRSADLHVQIAQAHLAMNQSREAVLELEKAAALNPAYPRTYYILGQAYRELGLRRKARRAWQQYLTASRQWGEEQLVLDRTQP